MTLSIEVLRSTANHRKLFFLNFGSHSFGGTANTAMVIAVSPINVVKLQIQQPHYGESDTAPINVAAISR